MKIIKKIISFALSVSMVASIFTINVSALTYVDGSNVTVINDGYYEIMSAECGKLLDIKDECTENGAVLQIWDKYPGNNNQIIKISSVGNCKIILQPNHVEGKGKVIEVRNSNMEDHGEVGMWDYVEKPCQQWYLYRNDDGTYSFQNVNSGLFLNVEGNCTENGTRVIQYHDDGTTAMKFSLFRLDDTDITTATWKMNEDNVGYMPYQNYRRYTNATQYSGFKSGKNMYLPAYDREYLYQINYIDYYTLLNTIGDAAKKETLERMFLTFSGEKITDIGTDLIIEYAQKKGLGYLADLALKKGGYLIEFLYMVYTNSSNNEWNRFVDNAMAAMRINSANSYYNKCGIKVVTYQRIFLDTNSSNSSGWIIKEEFSYSYYLWDELNIDREISTSGSWTYRFR